MDWLSQICVDWCPRFDATISSNHGTCFEAYRWKVPFVELRQNKSGVEKPGILKGSFQMSSNFFKNFLICLFLENLCFQGCRKRKFWIKPNRPGYRRMPLSLNPSNFFPFWRHYFSLPGFRFSGIFGRSRPTRNTKTR